MLLVDPEIDESLSGVTAKERIVLDGGDDAELFRPTAEPVAVGAGRGRHLHDQLHLGHHRPAQGRAAHAPQQLAQRDVFGWHTTVTDRDVLLHTLPMFHANGWGMP